VKTLLADLLFKEIRHPGDQFPIFDNGGMLPQLYLESGGGLFNHSFPRMGELQDLLGTGRVKGAITSFYHSFLAK
jgi:hypothetical protein